MIFSKYRVLGNVSNLWSSSRSCVVVLSPRTVSYLPLMPHSALRKEKPNSIMALGTLGHSRSVGFGFLFPALPRDDEI